MWTVCRCVHTVARARVCEPWVGMRTEVDPQEPIWPKWAAIDRFSAKIGKWCCSKYLENPQSKPSPPPTLITPVLSNVKLSSNPDTTERQNTDPADPIVRLMHTSSSQ